MNGILNIPSTILQVMHNYSDGLVVFGEKLIAPTKAGIGDCSLMKYYKLQQETSTIGLANLMLSTRTYVRYFKNNAGTTKNRVLCDFLGSGSLDDLAASYAGGAFKFEYKIPSSNASNSTAWQDGGKALSFSGDRNVDGNGGAQGSDSQFPLTISTTGTSINVSFNGGNWLNGEYMLIRVKASASWDGYLDRIEVS